MNTLSHPLPTAAPLPTPVASPFSEERPRAQTAHAPSRRLSFTRLFVLSIAVTATLLLVGLATLAASFLPGGEVRALRRAAFAADPGAWDRRIEFGVGRLPAFLARQGLRLAGPFRDIPQELRAGVLAFHGADIGLYHRQAGAPEILPSETLASIRTAMEQIGWEPAVTVQDDAQLVAIFIPSTRLDSSSRLTAAVFVMDRSDLVIVSARTDLQPLLDGILSAHPLPRLALHPATD
jgi:hypothetical protein